MGDYSHVLYLANSIIGVSVLTIPYCFKQCGIFLGVFALWLVGLLTKIVCHHLVKAALLARRRNYEMLAYQTFGMAGKLFVEICIIGYLMGCCIAFFVVIGDLTPEILGNIFGFDSHKLWIRNAVMIGSAVFFAYPLSLLRDIKSLGGICSASIGFYFLLIFKMLLEAAPKIKKLGPETTWWKSAGVLQVVPIFSMAQSCQTQVFEVYDSLPEPSLKHMDIVVSRAVDLCTFVYVATGILGYIAFGELTTGNAVMDLQPSVFTEVIKLGFVLSVLVSFPLLVFPCRSSMYSMLYGKATISLHDPTAATSIPEHRFKLLTAGILLSTLLVGLAVPNIEFVLGLVGATIGTIICIIVPAVLLLQVVPENYQVKERQQAQIVLLVGVTILIFGTYYSFHPIDSTVPIRPLVLQSDIGQNQVAVQELQKQEAVRAEPDLRLKTDPKIRRNPDPDARIEPALPFERDGGAPVETEEVGVKASKLHGPPPEMLVLASHGILAQPDLPESAVGIQDKSVQAVPKIPEISQPVDEIEPNVPLPPTNVAKEVGEAAKVSQGVEEKKDALEIQASRMGMDAQRGHDSKAKVNTSEKVYPSPVLSRDMKSVGAQESADQFREGLPVQVVKEQMLDEIKQAVKNEIEHEIKQVKEAIVGEVKEMLKREEVRLKEKGIEVADNIQKVGQEQAETLIQQQLPVIIPEPLPKLDELPPAIVPEPHSGQAQNFSRVSNDIPESNLVKKDPLPSLANNDDNKAKVQAETPVKVDKEEVESSNRNHRDVDNVNVLRDGISGVTRKQSDGDKLLKEEV